jgi:hypothetical protein
MASTIRQGSVICSSSHVRHPVETCVSLAEGSGPRRRLARHQIAAGAHSRPLGFLDRESPTVKTLPGLSVSLSPTHLNQEQEGKEL